ncbi:MAG: SDR family oxidoreductase, partial [Nostoc sp.]|uniref:SDR family oxidoreductase n=1 Tax=Nostoc sp. TaxID=1180 RepID=UPI002FF3B43C
MRVFVTGATGWVGTAVVKELIAAGHEVSGLVRSQANADALARAGGRSILGSLSDLDVLRNSASQVDGVIHTAFGLDMSKIAELSAEDCQAIKTFADAFMGSDRPFIVAGGIGIFPGGEIFTEEMSIGPVMPAFPRATEQTTMAMAERGVRATVVRLPRSVHGIGERHGFIPQLASLARKKGVSTYVEDGENLWPSVHRLDAARVFRLALEHGAQGGPFHAVAEEGIPFRQIAEVIGRQFQLPVVSISQEEASYQVAVRCSRVEKEMAKTEAKVYGCIWLKLR